MLRFNDGVNINTSGPLRMLELIDGFYVVGNGMCIPVKDDIEAKALITRLNEQYKAEDENR